MELQRVRPNWATFTVYLVINKMNEILYKFNATYHIIKLGFSGMEKLNYIYCFLLELLVYY